MTPAEITKKINNLMFGLHSKDPKDNNALPEILGALVGTIYKEIEIDYVDGNYAPTDAQLAALKAAVQDGSWPYITIKADTGAPDTTGMSYTRILTVFDATSTYTLRVAKPNGASNIASSTITIQK